MKDISLSQLIRFLQEQLDKGGDRLVSVKVYSKDPHRLNCSDIELHYNERDNWITSDEIAEWLENSINETDDECYVIFWKDLHKVYSPLCPTYIQAMSFYNFVLGNVQVINEATIHDSYNKWMDMQREFSFN